MSRQFLRSLLHYKSFALSILIFTVLLVGVIFESSLLAVAYSEKQQTEQEIQQMQSYLTIYREKSEKVRQSPFRAVLASKLDAVQSELLFHMQSYRLNLISLRDQQNKNEQNGHVYEIEFDGPYQDTMQFLSNFRIKNTMVGFEHLKLDQSRGVIHTKLRYKIYVRPDQSNHKAGQTEKKESGELHEAKR